MGVDAITAIRTDFPDARIIVLTTSSYSAFPDQVLDFGCVEAGKTPFQSLLLSVRERHEVNEWLVIRRSESGTKSRLFL